MNIICNRYVFYFSFLFVIFFNSCAFINSEDRLLPVGVLTGSIIQTTYSDNELIKNGVEVVYRFQSIPNLVFARKIPEDENIKTLLKDLISNTNRKSDNSLPNIYSIPIYDNTEDANEEAQFTNAHNLIKEYNINLSKIKIAVIDSGIYPSTQRINNNIIQKINISNDNDPCNWLDHATAIASILSGIITTKTMYTFKNVINSNIILCPNSDGYTKNPITGDLLYEYTNNANLISVKITFDGDDKKYLNNIYGSLQLAIAIDKAISAGANIINMSLSYKNENLSPEIQNIEKTLISQAQKQGVIFVVAAGNGNLFLDEKVVFPAKYNLDNLIVVGSHNNELKRSSFSNYGLSVDITAQGDIIKANDKRGDISYFSGTSFAAPLIASAISLYKGICIDSNYKDIINDLYASAKTGYAYNEDEKPYFISRYGRLNVLNFIKQAIQKCRK